MASKGGSLGGAIASMIFGYILFGIGFITILIRLYWLATVHIFKKLKQLLCRYDRLGAVVLGSIIGFLISYGFSHIYNNDLYYILVILFMAIFWLIGSKRFIAFFEPMFRKKCIYLDPKTKTIRECGLASPAYIGSFFVYIVGCVLGLMRFAFKCVVIFTMMTYISLTVTGLHNDQYCDSLAVAKQMGKYCIYVYMGVYILYNIPNYIIDTLDDTTSYKAFPINVLHAIMSVFEKPIRKLADVFKFEIGVYWTPLPIFFLDYIFAGKIIKKLHKIVDKVLTQLDKFIDVFRGYNCSNATSTIIAMAVEMNKFLNKKSDGDEESTSTNKSFWEDGFKSCKTIFNKYKQSIIYTDTSKEKNLKTKIIEMENKFSLNKESYSKENIKENIKDLFKEDKENKTGLYAFINNFRKSDIAKKYLGKIPKEAEELFEDIFNFNEQTDSKKEYVDDKQEWIKSKDNFIIKFLLKRSSCTVLAFMNIFTNLVDSYGNINRMKNDVKVSIVAGLACWFACFVMMILVATRHGKLS